MKFILLFLTIALASCKSSQSESANGDADQDQANDPGPAIFPEVVTYSGKIEKENEEKSPGINTTIEGKPATPSDSMAKVIAANTEPPKPVPTDEVKPGHPVAEPFPGEPGYVINPWTKEKFDVRGLPEGTLIRDPADPDPSHKFRVPDPIKTE